MYDKTELLTIYLKMSLNRNKNKNISSRNKL